MLHIGNAVQLHEFLEIIIRLTPNQFLKETYNSSYQIRLTDFFEFHWNINIKQYSRRCLCLINPHSTENCLCDWDHCLR